MVTQHWVQLPEQAWAALTSEKIEHVLVINETEKILVPRHLGYVDRLVRAIMPNFPSRRLDSVEVHWETATADADLAWGLLERKSMTDPRRFQIAQMLVDAGFGNTCVIVVVRRQG